MEAGKMANKIKAARLAAGMSQAELARAVDVHSSTISHWEREPAEPTAEMMERLVKVLPALAFRSKLDRDELGRIVREAWVEWAKTDPRSARRPDWLAPYDDLAESDKEADRCIGEAVAKAATERLVGEVERLTQAVNRARAEQCNEPHCGCCERLDDVLAPAARGEP